MMYSHIMLGSKDIQESKKFYDATLAVLGHRHGVMDEKGRIYRMDRKGVFSIGTPIDGNPACHGNGSTIGYAVDSPEQPDEWHAVGLANGGR